MKLLIIGGGIYVQGSNYNERGTIIPSIIECIKDKLIDQVCFVTTSNKSANSCINKCSKGSSKEGFAGVSVDELADDVISDITEDRKRKQDEKDKVNAVLEANPVKKISQVNASKETDHTTQDKSSDLIFSITFKIRSLPRLLFFSWGLKKL